MKKYWSDGILKSKSPWNKGTQGIMVAWNKGKKYFQISGEKHWSWKGGITKPNKLVRCKAEWKDWRKKVFERDDYACQMCANRGGKNYDGNIYIEPHHIFRVVDLIKNKFEQYVYDIRNGITLCYDCHKSILRR